MSGADELIPLASSYEWGQPNENLCLYEGGLRLDGHDGEGEIRFEWLPFPETRFDVRIPGEALPSPQEQAANVTLEVDDWTVEATVMGRRWTADAHGHRTAFQGSLPSTLRLGSGERLASIDFHLANYHLLRPIEFDMPDGWKVAIGPVISREQREDLKASGGYAITHVGRLTRSDQSPFTAQPAETCLTALGFFLTFTRGGWTMPLLAVGFDDERNVVWRDWGGSKKIDRWGDDSTWCDPTRPDIVAEASRGFLQRWNDALWREILVMAVFWFVIANRHGAGVEGSIVLAQTALELLGWGLLVEERQTMRRQQFDRLAAATKIRNLLTDLGIPTDIPVSLQALTAIATAENWGDGPQAITRLRNAMIHPNARNRGRVLGSPTAARVECGQLGVWYLELAILALTGFSGSYSNRLAQRCVGEVEPVPWAANDDEA